MSNFSEKINIGAADLTFIPAGSEIPVYLGLTKDGTILEYDPEYHDISADQLGKTPIDSILLGEGVKVTANLLQTDLEHIAVVCPTATLEKEEQSNGEQKTKAVTFGQRPGLRLLQKAGLLRIHPLAAGRNITDRDVLIYKAVNKKGLKLAYKQDEEWVIPAEFIAFPDMDRPDGDMLFRIGEQTEIVEGSKRVVAFWITPANPEVVIAEKQQFRANAMYEDGSTEDVTIKCTWKSSDISTASINTDTGELTAVAKGTCLVMATYIGYSNTTTVTVKEAEV